MPRPLWLRPWPWWWEPRKTRRPSRDAVAAKEESTERLRRAEDQAAEVASRVTEDVAVIERLREITAELWPGHGGVWPDDDEEGDRPDV